jgi:chemotaxis protein methyltransferase CheR
VSWSQPAFESIAAVLCRRTGLSFSPQRRPGAEQGIHRAMRRAGVADLEAYAKRLETEENALDDLIVELTVGETYFFREPDQFAFLRREVLPALRARVTERFPGSIIRAWSAGCASGEEAYSLAMLFDSEGLAGQASVLATDISHAALAKARQGVYRGWSLRGDGAAQARPYLSHADSNWTVTDSIRRLVTFAHLNLALDVYPSLATGTWGMDLIFCRNVLIYFDEDTIAAVARRLFAALAPGGWFFLASSDPPLNQMAPFEIVVAAEGVFYRRPVAHPSPPAPLPEAERGEEEKNPSPQPPPRSGEGEPKKNPSPRPPPRRGEGEEDRRQPRTPPLSPAGSPLSASGRGAGGEGFFAPPSPLRGGGPGGRGEESVDPLTAARAAFAAGEYTRVLDLTFELATDADACALRVRALANLDAVESERACAEAAAARHALCPELHFLHGTLVLALGRDGEAAGAVRRALYLDRSLAAAHCILGAILERRGDMAGARRAFRNARDLCAGRPADEEVPLTDGERAGRLAEAARARLALLSEQSPDASPSPAAIEVPK